MTWRLFSTKDGKTARATTESAAALYRTIVVQARQPAFYATYGVPDTLDGRFEMISLHMFFVLHRLKEDAEARQLSQDLFDMMFGDMDRCLREMGVGDLGVGRRVRAMAEGLYGRMAAYEAGLAADDEVLAAALRRNLYGTVRDADPSPTVLDALCGYMHAAVRELAAQKLPRLEAGDVTFPAVPAA